jgi:hypothetical protein
MLISIGDMGNRKKGNVKCEAPRQQTGLLGNVLSFVLCPSTPPARRGLRDTYRPKLKVQIYKNSFKDQYLTLLHRDFI